MVTVTRAAGEAWSRHSSALSQGLTHGASPVALLAQDLQAALSDFVPASLRGVKLFKSTVAWADVGGLQEAKRILKETVEFPIKYERMFSGVFLLLVWWKGGGACLSPMRQATLATP